MSMFELILKETLFSMIDEMEKNVQKFVMHPGKDCTRNRKLGFANFMRFTLSLSAKSTNGELLRHFDYSLDTPTTSAYCQQRAKIAPYAFRFLLDKFTDTLPKTKLYKGYRLIACDGSALGITRSKPGDDTFIQSGNKRGYSMMHVSAFYDLLNGLFLDAITTTKKEMNEKGECITMIDRSNFTQALLIADRGYENYNLFAHVQEKGWKYLIRAKDIDQRIGIVHGCHLGLDGPFDVIKDIRITRRDSKNEKEHKDVYKVLSSYHRRFDFIEPGDTKSDYPMSLRIVRIKIGEDQYETLITNLDQNEVTSEEIKQLYNMRWGIETSFRELKYYVGMLNFHAKKPDYISQEIYSSLIIYNFCKAVMNNAQIQQKANHKYQYRLNLSAAVSVCRQFLFDQYVVPPDLEMLLKNILHRFGLTDLSRETLPIRNP